MGLLKYFIAYFSLFAISKETISQDYIRMENIGPNLKYFDILLVSNGKIPDTTQFPATIYKLDSPSYGKYRAAIIKYLPNMKAVDHPIFGTFEVIVKNHGSVNRRYLLNAKIAIEFFKNVNKSLTRSNIDIQLIHTIDQYIKMLGG